MVKRLTTVLTLLFVLSLTIKANVGKWTLYQSYKNITYCEVVGDKIYILASGALYSYNTKDNEVRTYDKINTLSDVGITHIAYSNYLDAIVILYDNANIDVLYSDESVYNISDFKNKVLPSKKINGINIQDSIAYNSTDFGVVVLNLENLEFSNTYNLGLNTYSSICFKDKIYAATSNGVYSCEIAKNPLDKANWVQMTNTQTEALTVLENKLYSLVKETGIYIYDQSNNTFSTVVKNSGEKYQSLYNNGSEIVASAKDKTTIIKSDNTVFTYKNSNNIHTTKKGNRFFDCKGYDGIVKYSLKDNKIENVSKLPVPDSPIRNYCEFMKFTENGKLLVAGGNINYFDNTFYNGTVMQFTPSEQKWFNFPEDTIKKVTGYNYVNICSVDEDPTEPGHFFASSFGYGLYEFRNGEFIKHHNHTNSPLESVSSGQYSYAYVRTPYVKFDKDGNLWCINTDVKDIIKVLLKKDGNWISLNYKEMENMATVVKPYIDSRGWLWVTILQSNPGLFCAKIKNTPFDTSDDVTKKWINKFTNQDGISYDIYQLYDMCEDKNGEIWVGTNIGIFVIDNPEKFFNDGIFKQIKIARNDGTGLADYFMSGEYIKAIAVDGANRKWIGTNDNGIYLVSEDGKETIHHFTTDNSPLPSNTIESIAINDLSGEVFIGTGKGIASYMSDATKSSKTLEDDNIHVYPNPVTSTYNGKISIVGLTMDCNVKIVDAAGYLVNEGTSNGGMYTWNGRDKRGEKVTSGVYYVLTYDEEGNEGATTKIVITR